MRNLQFSGEAGLRIILLELLKIMKKLFLTLIFVGLVCAGVWAQGGVKAMGVVSVPGVVSAPHVVSTVPTFGDCEVDPGLTKIVIRFDQDMMPSYSVMNSENFPQVTGKPVWDDKRTLSIPVKLFPGKLYTMQLNSSRTWGFSNLEGIPLSPVDLLFQTEPASNDTTPTSDDSTSASNNSISASMAKLNKKSFAEFKKFFPKEYSYASLKGVDWNALLKEYKDELVNSKTNTEFALKLIKLLRKADDAHLWIDVDGKRFETGKIKPIEENVNMNHLFTLLQNRRVGDNLMSVVGEIDGVGYIAIRGWTADINRFVFKTWGDEKDSGITLDEVIRNMSGYSDLIIDVRENGGGNEAYARDFASYFIKDSVAFEKVVCYNEKSGLVNDVQFKKVYPNKKGLNYTGNIYVLSGPVVMSSNESFVLMMKQVPNAKVVGMKTYGSSGNPVPHKLSNGVTIFLPSWQAYTLDGKLIEGSGVDPDIEIVTSRKDFEKEDILIQKVLKMIKK